MIKIKHYLRSCVVVIKKPKIRVFDDYQTAVTYILDKGILPTADTWKNIRLSLATEEKTRLRGAIKSGLLLDSDSDPDYFYIIVNGLQYKREKDKDITNLNIIDQTWETPNNFNVRLPANRRVMSVSVQQTTKTAWTATVMLDNTNNVFNLEDIEDFFPQYSVTFQKNENIIESNDEISIYLPDWKDELALVFTGYINTVIDDDDGIEKRIRLSCEDVTKRMSVSRSNANPSLDPIEAEGNTVTPYQAAWLDKSPEQVLRYIFGRAFSDIFKDLTWIDRAKSELSELNTKERKKKNKPKSTEREKAFQALNQAIDNLIDEKYIDVLKDGDVEIGYIGYKVKSVTVESNNTDREIAFVILGMNQPVWALQMRSGAYDYLISDWKSNDQIINDIAKKTFFEFYAFPSGIAFFGPTNLTLPMLYDKDEKGKEDFNNIMKDNYWITEDKDIYVRKYTQSMDDRHIFTDIIIVGMHYAGAFTYSLLRKLVISPYTYRRKFGVRMMPQETRVGLVEPKSLQAYGEQRLWRQNAEYYSASILLEGNGHLQPGVSCYVDRWTSVYYISEVSHSFVSGGDFSTEIKLIYKRKPLMIYKGDGVLNDYLTSLVDKQEMSEEQKKHIWDNRDYLKWGKTKHFVPDSTLGYFEGTLIWETIPTNLYPADLQLDHYLTTYLDKAIAKVNTEYYKNIKKSGAETKRLKEEWEKEKQVIKEYVKKLRERIDIHKFRVNTLIKSSRDAAAHKFVQ